MKLYNNYEATQDVLKVTMNRLKEKFTMEDAQVEGEKMGVMTPATPSAHMNDLASGDIPVFAVDRLLDLIGKLEGFSTLPMYKKIVGGFKHIGIENRYNHPEDAITDIADLSYDQMNYLASVRPGSLKRFLLEYKRLVAQRDELKKKDLAQRKLLNTIYMEIVENEEEELDTDTLEELKKYSDRQY